LVLYILYRMTVREARPVEDQESFVMYTPSSVTEELDPRVEYQEHSMYFEEASEQLQQLLYEDENQALQFFRSVSIDNPEWIASLVQRVPDLGKLDLIVLYRTLALSAPDHLNEFVTAVTESEYHDAQELVDWLIEKEPENTYSTLAAISTAQSEYEQINVVEAIAESHPEKIPEFTQELFDSVVESTENMRAPDREQVDWDETVSDYISEVEASAPEHTEEATEIAEQTIEEWRDSDSEEEPEAAAAQDEASKTT
ncbi:MAG: MFS transporter, partial [Vibrio sp.]